MSDSSGSGVKATIVTNSKTDNKRVEKTFAIDVPKEDNSGSHLNSLRNCVNRLETQLNQYLTQIIDEENESGASGVSDAVSQPIASNSVYTHKDKKMSTKNAFNADDYGADTRRQSQEPKHKRDFLPVLREPEVFKDLIEILKEQIESTEPKAEAIIGLESRGFLLAPILSLNLKLPFIPVRKAGKLAGSVSKVEYSLEYGKDSLEIQTESITKGLKCVVIDDLIATGGSLKATIDLISGCGGQVVKSLVVIELVELKGRSNIPSPIYSMIQY